MATTTTTPKVRESHTRLKPKPKTEGKSWQTRNAARRAFGIMAELYEVHAQQPQELPIAATA